MEIKLTEETIKEIITLVGGCYDNVKEEMLKALSGDVDSLVKLINDANQCGWSNGYDAAVFDSED